MFVTGPVSAIVPPYPTTLKAKTNYSYSYYYELLNMWEKCFTGYVFIALLKFTMFMVGLVSISLNTD